jgi:adenylate cyclase
MDQATKTADQATKTGDRASPSRRRPKTAAPASAAEPLRRLDSLADWLIAQTLVDADVETVIAGCCARLAEAGVPILRAHFSFSVLHPLYSALGYLWHREGGLEVSGYRHLRDGMEPDRYLNSPYYHLRKNRLAFLRRSPLAEGEPEFPVLADLRAEGATDYVAYAIGFDSEGAQAMMGSWATDRPGGFSDADMYVLEHIQDRLAVACKVGIRGAIMRRLLSTYLGPSAADRVLSGQIKRGDADTIRAAIVWGDLRDSTALAERLGRGPYSEVLNLFFDTVAGAIEDAGGEVLSLAGDGFLAVFPTRRRRRDIIRACRKALAGALEAPERMAEVNAERERRRKEPLHFGLGLHVGNIMYGNVGLVDRLAFSAFGATVNEAVRLQEIAKAHGTPVVASAEFVDYVGGDWESLGEKELRGFEQPVDVFRPAGQTGRERRIPRRERSLAGLTDAEAIVLLHRSGG